MENRAYTMAAGVFVVLLLAMLIGAIAWFNDRGHIHGTPYDLITRTSVAGLAVGATVTLRGVQIGQVQSIQFDTADPATVRVRIAVDPRFMLRKGSYATLDYQGLSGNAYVDLDFPNQEHEVLTSNAGTPARIPLGRSSWATLPDTGEHFLTSFTTTLGRVDSILTPENAQHLSRMLMDFSAAAQQITGLVRDLRPAASRIDILTLEADDTLRSAHKTLGDIDSLAVGFQGHLGALDALGEGARQTGLAAQGVKQALVGDSLPKLDRVLDGLSQNSDALQELLEQLRKQPQSVLFGTTVPPPGPGEGTNLARRPQR
jgi:phospholipid/cholesterol/gamma-HCH transport system substrate-binding protein